MVTWEALIRILIGIVGAGIAGYGVLYLFASGFAAAPEPSEARKGCGTVLIGLVILAAAIFA